MWRDRRVGGREDKGEECTAKESKRYKNGGRGPKWLVYIGKCSWGCAALSLGWKVQGRGEGMSAICCKRLGLRNSGETGGQVYFMLNGNLSHFSQDLRVHNSSFTIYSITGYLKASIENPMDPRSKHTHFLDTGYQLYRYIQIDF